MAVGGGLALDLPRGVRRLLTGVVQRVGAQVLESLLALGHKLFEGREEKLAGGGPAVDHAVLGRLEEVLPPRQVLQAGAPAAVGRVRALRAARGARVEAATAARAPVHGLQEQAAGRAAAGRAVGRRLLLVQEVLHLLR